MLRQEPQKVTMDRLVKEYHLPHIEKDVATIDNLKLLPEVIGARRMSLCMFVGICTSGVASVYVNGSKRVATHNQVVVITDESVVDRISFSDDFEGYGVFMSYGFLQDILSDLYKISNLYLLTHNHPLFEVNDSEMSSLRAAYKLLHQRVKAKKHRFSREVARLSILSMIYETTPAIDRIYSTNEISEDKQSRVERVFVNFIRLLEGCYKEHRTVSWYAEQLGITAKYLSESVSSVSRRTPNQWIDKFVCTEIRNQLRHTNKSIADIAKDLNFSNQSLFGRYFRSNTGVSPSDYRNGDEGKKL